MSQKLTIIFDLDGTLVETAPDLISAHNHVMAKYGLESKKYYKFDYHVLRYGNAAQTDIAF